MTEEAKITLDEQATRDLANLALGMSRDKELRPLVNKFLKKTSGKVLPDVEMEELRAEIKSDLEKEKQEREAEKVKLRLEAQRDSLKSRYEDKDISEIEKLMEKYGLSDYEAAAKLYAADTTPAEPTHDIGSQNWELPKVEVKDLGNLVTRRRSNIHSVIGDIIKQRKAS